MTKPVTLEQQVQRICDQVAIRSEQVQKMQAVQARLKQLCDAMKEGNQKIARSTAEIQKRVPIAESSGERSFQNLFIVLQMVADLQEIEDLAKLRSKTADLRQKAAELEASAKSLRADAEKFRDVMKQLKEARAKKKST